MVDIVTPDSSVELLHTIRQRALTDFYFFNKFVLGYRDMTVSCHKPVCDFISDRTWRQRSHLSPRRHLKTSIVTIGYGLWRATIDPYESVMIRSEGDNAFEFHRKIRQIVEFSPIYNLLFGVNAGEYRRVPDFSSKKHRWSDRFSDLYRPPGGFYVGPTFQAIGIEGHPTGRNVTLLIDDDIFTLAAANSEAEAEQRWGAFREGRNLLVNPKLHERLLVGTHWHTWDVYVRAFEEHGALFLSPDGDRIIGMNQPNPGWLVWRRSCYNEAGNPIWPERYDEEVLEQTSRELGPHQFSLLWLNNPVASGNVDFSIPDLRYWEYDTEHPGAIKLYDPVAGRWSEPVWLDDLNPIMILDPGAGLKEQHSPTGILVMAAAPNRAIIVLATYKKRVKIQTEDGKGWLDQMYRFQRQYDPYPTYIESAAFQKVIGPSILDERNRHETHRIHWEEAPLGGRTAAKPIRIRDNLQPPLVEHRVHVHKSHMDLIEEIRIHPVGKNKELLDCFAHGVQRLAYPTTAADRAERTRADRVVQAGLGAITGYGWDYDAS